MVAIRANQQLDVYKLLAGLGIEYGVGLLMLALTLLLGFPAGNFNNYDGFVVVPGVGVGGILVLLLFPGCGNGVASSEDLRMCFLP